MKRTTLSESILWHLAGDYATWLKESRRAQVKIRLQSVECLREMYADDSHRYRRMAWCLLNQLQVWVKKLNKAAQRRIGERIACGLRSTH